MTQGFNPYEGMGDAKTSDKLPHLTEGRYVVQIDRIHYMTARAGYPATIAEFTILESSNPAHPAGVQRSYFQKMNVDAAKGALKVFSAALAGVDPKDAKALEAVRKDLEMLMYKAIQVDNPCRGLRVGVVVSNIKTKEQKDFSKHDWYPVEQAA